MEPLNLTVTNRNNCIVCVFINFWPYIKLFWFFKSVSDKNVRAVEFSALQLNSNQFYSSTWWHDIKTWLTDFICFLLTNTVHQTRGKLHPKKVAKQSVRAFCLQRKMSQLRRNLLQASDNNNNYTTGLLSASRHVPLIHVHLSRSTTCGTFMSQFIDFRNRFMTMIMMTMITKRKMILTMIMRG